MNRLNYLPLAPAALLLPSSAAAFYYLGRNPALAGVAAALLLALASLWRLIRN
jgi:hypothetical protein